MATAQKLTDHFLTCTVCHEIFTDPSTLDCGHSFCGPCIVGFTKTRANAIRSKSIPCPFCRRQTRVPNPSRPVEEWAGQMRPTLLLKGLLDTIGPGTKDTINCNWCHDEGETTPAVSWCPVCDVSLCSICLKAHKRSPSTKHHDVSDVTDEVKVKGRTKVMCPEHKEEFVKFFCRDCRRTLCQSCCILYHRKCELVVSLESMLPEMRSSLEKEKETMMKKSRVEEEELEYINSRCRELQDKTISIKSQIRSAARSVIEAVKKKEKELLNELAEVTDKEMDQLKAGIKTGNMARDIYRQQSGLIDQALNSEGEMDMYDLYQSIDSEAAESVGDVKKRGTRTRIEFLQDVDGLDKALRELSLGKIQVLGEVDLDTVSTPVLSDTVDCRTKEDQDKPILYDIMSMEVKGLDTLIVTDFKNKCIKSFFKRNKKQQYSRLTMNSGPWVIAMLQDNKLAVTLPDSQQISVLSVTPDLTLDSTITTQKQYYGLTTLTSTTLAAGSYYPPRVNVIDRSGKVMRVISPIHNGEKIIQKPYNLCTTRQGNILVSDWETKSVVCVTPQGEVVFNYSPTGDKALSRPAGINSTATGHILVVDYHGDKVVLLRESGEFVRDLLTRQQGICGPLGIDWDERGRIYVTHCTATGVNVQVFTLK